MLANFVKTAWRNIVRHKAYAAINISGLAVGIAACILLFTVVRFELSYDTFQPNFNRIYHLASQRISGTETEYAEGLPHPAYDALKTDFPNITKGALYANWDCQVTVLNPTDPNTASQKKFIEGDGNFFSDPNIFSVFHYKWLSGSAAVLKDPDVVVLTKKRAEKYFGNWQSATGRLLLLDNKATVKVAGILEDFPVNTDFPIELVASYETAKKYPATYNYNSSFGNVSSNFQAFMLLPENVLPATVNKQLIAFSDKYYNSGARKNDRMFHFLQPLKDIHFDTRISNFGDHITSRSTLWTLSLIGIFIIIMACINFINLSTAQAVGRSKEVGIRKVLGSNRSQLFWQMIAETAVIVLVAVILGFCISVACTPLVKHIASIPGDINLFTLPTLVFTGIIMLLVTLLAGTYPSLVLTVFKPTQALKNKISSANIGGISLRRGLVVTQFAISQVLIMVTLVAVNQMNFVRNADLGFNKEQVLVLSSNVDSSVNQRQQAFKQRLLAIPGVKAVSFSSDVPSSESNSSSNFSFDHKPDEDFDLYRKFADEDYYKAYGLEIIAGRPHAKSDTATEVVVNETMVAKLGIKDPQSIIGHEIRLGRATWVPIVGVVKDFKTNSLREAIKPTIITSRNIRYYYTGIKFDKGSIADMQARVEKVWNDVFPEFVYSPSFMDERVNNFYKQENQSSLLYKIFAGIAIFISCLGLYGLISFMTAQKTKEVGIRKVLGATIANVIYLFSKEFTLLIVIAFVIAVPAAWYVMNSWLNNFAFRIDIGIGVFLLAILCSVMIAWITVGYKALKAAKANPVKSLKAE